MLTTIQQELATAWDAVAEWLRYVLMREGLESVALRPLARTPRAAEWIARRESRSDEAPRRVLAAKVAGALGVAAQSGPSGAAGGDNTVDPDLLSELFENETRRLRETPHEDASSAQLAGMEAGAVVAHLVDAAALWAGAPSLRAPALEILRRILETALAGDGWTNLERAAMVLARHGSRQDREILARLRRMLAAGPDNAGAAIIDRLLMGETDLIDDDEESLRFGERAAAEFQVAGEALDVLNWMLEAAGEFEAAA